MSEILERVVRALQDSGLSQLCEDAGWSGESSIIAQRMARAAIEAMREPTAAMSEAIGLQAHKPTGWHSVYPNMWRAGIDAALNDKP